MRTDHEVIRLKRQVRQNRSAVGIALGQSTTRAPIDNAVITPEQIDPKVRPSVVDTSTITTEIGTDYTANPPDIYMSIKWMGIPNENIAKYELALAPTDTNLWQFYTVEVTNAQYGAGFKYGDTSYGQTAYTIHGLQPNKQYRFKIRAFNILNRWGEWTEAVEDYRFITGRDEIPPPKFDINQLTLLAGAGFVIGKITQEQQPDFKQWEVAASTNSGFVPTEDSIKWSGYAHVFTFDFVNTNANGTTDVYIKVREVDSSDNLGEWSDQKKIAVGRTIGTLSLIHISEPTRPY
jgi:hypothetical protein